MDLPPDERRISRNRPTWLVGAVQLDANTLTSRGRWLHGRVRIDRPQRDYSFAQIGAGEPHDGNLGLGKVQSDVVGQIGQQVGVAGAVRSVVEAPLQPLAGAGGLGPLRRRQVGVDAAIL